ncbi:hypothetical protein [Albidovulum sediminis]|uniref:Uncharacterized protein n=1 Tax=Albidovulum sediminis TaxID=3066345 RepID=A0ABT2NLD3_9RHOB|nr:hypothetical protein [Defluviimonas sediminis]MCT8329721.1 hypothetical protein [Defluviimonas sediminis]
MTDLPDYYFRIRENGAAVFRIDTANRQRRIEMDQIAVVNVKTGDIRPHGGRTLSQADLQAIGDWLARRQDLLAARETDDILRLADQMNQVAHWVQSKATEAQVAAVSDALLLAMHDLRGVLVRKQAGRPDAPEAEAG